MNNEQLISKIFNLIDHEPFRAEWYDKLLSACMLEDMDATLAQESNKRMRELLSKNLTKLDDVVEGYEIYKRSLLFGAKADFDAYMLYLEIDRKPSERFYAPRRERLLELVQGLQDLADDRLDELFLSMPPRVGKTTVLMMFVTWLVGRNSEMSNLYCAYSDTITSAFYTGVLEIIQDAVTYRWADVFPSCKVASTSAKEELLNIDRVKRYPSLTCRSLYGTLNGACDCNGFLISDDLLSGIEEALNKDRLVTAWGKVDNNLLTRAKETAKILWCGTRWSIADPIGIRISNLENDEKFSNRRYRIINLPALDEHDESNFDYKYQVGFSTDYYHQRRASFERNNDMASWDAQYQGSPIEREGALFTPDTMRYYNGVLPDGEPDRVYMAVDPAFGGGDYVAGPVVFKYGDDLYVHDVVFNNGDKKITQPLLVKAVINHQVKAMRIEANKSTESYKDEVEAALKAQGYRLNITTKAAATDKSKLQRIFDKAPDIRERMIFRESGKRSREYELFMQNVFSFKLIGKNLHDDAPDALAMAIDMDLNPVHRIEVFKRPF